MSLRRRLFSPLLAAGWLGLTAVAGVVGPVQADPAPQAEITIATDTEGAMDLARKALASGRAELAASIARQILAADPGNAGAHMMLAAALTRSGDGAAALPAARAGFRLSNGREEHFEAAYLTAEAAALGNRPWLAKYWLRRADLYAPSPAHEAALSRAYGAISAKSPLSFSLSLFGGPSGNVNGGSMHDTFWFHGIPIPIAQAMPGQILGGAMRGSYRLGTQSQISLTWARREVVLGQRARAIDPKARASDFRRDDLTLAFSQRWQDKVGRTALQLDLSVGRRWNAGAISADRAGGEVSLEHLLREDWALGGKLSYEAAKIANRPVADSQTSRLTFLVSHRAAGLGAVTLELGAADVASEAAGIAWRGPIAAVGWRPALDSGWLDLNLDLSFEQRNYWRTPDFAPDQVLGLSVTANLRKLEFMGFNPAVTVSGARTRSQVVARDTNEFGVSLGISSSF